MCGIAGALAPEPSSRVPQLVTRLTDGLRHRGPDGEGFWADQSSGAGRISRASLPGEARVVFGHRRLSIVDLECGAQPMANEDGRVWVVLNGELYNHVDLRRELEALGHRFRTRADTEVLVHGWEQWGRGLLPRLNGMYAFALFDGRRERGGGDVWLARDPVGVKPLYLGLTSGTWWFSSELAAARASGLLASDFRPEAFDEYLVYRFVPSPGTFFPNAWKVPPGHLCRLETRSLPVSPIFERFEAAFQPASVPSSEHEWEEAIRAGLRAAVKRQLMSDVPVGTLLSGGVDSTVITRVMEECLPDAPQAFAVGFADLDDIDELSAARRAAGVLGIPLKEVSVGEEEYLASWPAQIAALSEPIANPGVLLVGLLCRTVRASRKVVLTGQGADEPLGGYPRHVAERFYPWAKLVRPLLARLPERIMSDDRLARMRRITGQADEAHRFAEILAVFGPSEAIELTGHRIDRDDLAEPVRRWLGNSSESDSLNRLLKADARLSLADDLLIVADHMSMASSVELRVPFLDLEFLGLVERMPSRFKVGGLGERKWLYRQAAASILPQELRGALTGWGARVGRKLGFTAPLKKWFHGWLATEAEHFLLGPKAKCREHLRPEGIRSLVRSAQDRRYPRTRQMLSLFVLETWLRGEVEGSAHSP